jgi:hypothetical protein
MEVGSFGLISLSRFTAFHGRVNLEPKSLERIEK